MTKIVFKSDCVFFFPFPSILSARAHREPRAQQPLPLPAAPGPQQPCPLLPPRGPTGLPGPGECLLHVVIKQPNQLKLPRVARSGEKQAKSGHKMGHKWLVTAKLAQGSQRLPEMGRRGPAASKAANCCQKWTKKLKGTIEDLKVGAV